MAFNAAIFAGMGEAAREKQTRDREERSNLLANLNDLYTGLSSNPRWASQGQQHLLQQAQMEIATADPGDRKSSSAILKKWSNLIPAGTLPATPSPQVTPQVPPGMGQLSGRTPPSSALIEAIPRLDHLGSEAAVPIPTPTPTPLTDQEIIAGIRPRFPMSDEEMWARKRRETRLTGEVDREESILDALALIAPELKKAEAIRKARGPELSPVSASITIGGDRGPFLFDEVSATFYKTDPVTGQPVPAIGEMGFYEESPIKGDQEVENLALLSAVNPSILDGLTPTKYGQVMGHIAALVLEGDIEFITQSAQSTLGLTESGLESLEGLEGIIERAGGKPPGVGYLQGRLPPLSEAASDFRLFIDQLKSLITLPQLEHLRGLGHMSDREFRAIVQSVTALDPKMTEDSFKSELAKIKAQLERTRERIMDQMRGVRAPPAASPDSRPTSTTPLEAWGIGNDREVWDEGPNGEQRRIR
jgi:hypothetical protein